MPSQEDFDNISKQIYQCQTLKEERNKSPFTEEEKKEQALLRQEFVANVRQNMRNQLNNIDMVNEDGTIENLGEKYGDKKINS